MEENYAFGRVLSTDPLITISKRAMGLGQPMGFAGLLEDVETAGPSLHLVGLTFSMEPHHFDPDWGVPADSVSILARDHAAISKRCPNATFVILANTEGEVFELSRLGVPCILANELIFTDEREFDLFESDDPLRFGAVYNAVLMYFKRHWLASEVDTLTLIFRKPDPNVFDLVASNLPRARYANLSDINQNRVWKNLSQREIAMIYARCDVGLCLSPVEGSMRSSMEYLLCGLPIVSTPSLGGRDRYFRDDYAIICKPNPSAVAEAVREAASLSVSRAQIRRAALDSLEFDRANFLRALNKLIRRELKAPLAFESFDGFRHVPIHAAPMDTTSITTALAAR